MARCPFAVWKPITGSSGSYLGGPFKIVHHTTEGFKASDAMRAYRDNRSDPHFTVDATTIYQHIDTGAGARSLENLDGGVQTNRDSAVQIEVVGFAGRPKDRETLANVERLCRWIETTHGIPKVWPNGFPRFGARDPGGHNRNRTNWDTKGGHYGHSHVPENDHWDPGYTRAEVEIVMGGILESLEPELEAFALLLPSEIEVEIDNLVLTTYLVTVPLDAKGQGVISLDVVWERVISIIPKIEKNGDGVWQTCTVALAEEDGQTLLVATGGMPETTITVLVKTLDANNLSAESVGCP
ncbi:peptidoglycan recognition protein family protein [Synechocystis sp. PCC 7509]|uniref:peptidoglycan recognition protein family protein n=1 Tax=Synechocystis sp. PCC 7509 TaxID=927677 RepID=UPI0002AC783D|nr:peptidoglycan recognition family protein [Synechocystis sp. PCC 7509]